MSLCVIDGMAIYERNITVQNIAYDKNAEQLKNVIRVDNGRLEIGSDIPYVDSLWTSSDGLVIIPHDIIIESLVMFSGTVEFQSTDIIMKYLEVQRYIFAALLFYLKDTNLLEHYPLVDTLLTRTLQLFLFSW